MNFLLILRYDMSNYKRDGKTFTFENKKDQSQKNSRSGNIPNIPKPPPLPKNNKNKHNQDKD